MTDDLEHTTKHVERQRISTALILGILYGSEPGVHDDHAMHTCIEECALALPEWIPLEGWWLRESDTSGWVLWSRNPADKFITPMGYHIPEEGVR